MTVCWHKKLMPRAAGPRVLVDIGAGNTGGLADLTRDLTINSITVSPLYRYEGRDASATALNAAVGTNLPAAGSGGSFGGDTPMPGLADESFNPSSSRFYQDVGTSFGDITTEDMVIELVFSKDPGVGRRIIGKESGGAGYDVAMSGAPMELTIGDGATTVIATANIDQESWIHAMAFVDRSGSAQWHINGNASGAPVVVSGVGSLANASQLTAGATAGGASIYNRPIAYIAMWARDTWLDTHLQAAVAQQRFHALTGVITAYGQPVHANLRQSSATLEKTGHAGSQRLLRVGDRWPRICRVKDLNGQALAGYMSEVSHTNLVRRSEDFWVGAVWTPVNLTAGTGTHESPRGNPDAGKLSEDGTAASTHYIWETFAQTATLHLMLCHIKPINRDWVRLSLSSATDGSADVYFNLAGNGAVGTESNNDDAGIRSIGDGWYECWFTDTRATAEIATWALYLADADGSSVFDGLSQDSVVPWGAMAVPGVGFPVSYIRTITALSRAKDWLTYTGLTLPGEYTLAADVLSWGRTDPSLRGYVYAYLSDGSTVNFHRLQDDSSAAPVASRLDVASTTVADVQSTTGIRDGQWHEVRGTIRLNDARLYIDGTEEGTPDASLPEPTSHTRIDVGVRVVGNGQSNSIVRLKLLDKVNAHSRRTA